MVEYYCPHCKSLLTYTGATSAGEILLYCTQCHKQIEFSAAEKSKFSLWGWVTTSIETKEESDDKTS